MSLHYVIREITKKHEYNNIYFSDEHLNHRLRDRNLEVWQKENRYIVTKGYTSIAQFNDWLHDQIVISFIYDTIPAHSRNNLYFLIVVDFKNERDKEMVWKITEIEKNDRVCRKYVVEEREDLKRVPALNNNFKESDAESIMFEKQFKNKLFNNKAILSEYGEVTQSVKNLVDVYFEIYDEQEKKDEEKKILIEKVITVGSEEN
ncbi:hypothetical protein ABE55_19870 [Bacillus thuringiensis]|uniref:ABC-three component system middle component 1 n=1 Tax=Bacillus cereus group TaxID=86661 RepID=UPI000BF39EB0|nr:MULTISPECIES: ABC-three component system middle component 1 [Bacillus cereus group]MBG9468757.1 hypothetical protein [Bacillus thuringiensis]PES30318.1 hypothetical protein CN496_09425 [Bacillus cereus]PET84998.1 hypothetical protein CN528_06720 [Bacillus cereus]